MKNLLFNCVRLLLMLIILSSAFVLRLAIQPSGYELVYMYPNIPSYLLHLCLSIIILLGGGALLSRYI